MVVTLGQLYNVGEKPAVILHAAYINRHAGTDTKSESKTEKCSTTSNIHGGSKCLLPTEYTTIYVFCLSPKLGTKLPDYILHADNNRD